jgi:hypothetical protein
VTDVRVCFWNIQNYGAGGGANSTMHAKWGANSALRNQFIAALMASMKVDVLWIMEASSGSDGSLQNLVDQMNTAYKAEDWAMALAGCGLQNRAPNPPTAPVHTTYRADARSEGYAVLWRTDQEARFRVLDGLHDLQTARYTGIRNPAPPTHSPINFTTFGRPAGMVTVTTMKTGKKPSIEYEEYRALGGYLPQNTRPYDKNGQLIDWPELKMPTTGRNNPNQLAMARARRAAYVVLALGNNNILCPVCVYHAPSNRSQAQWGAMQAALGRDLYVTNALAHGRQPDPKTLQHAPRALIGGDFNYQVVDFGKWPEDYLYFVGSMGKDGGGAGMRESPAARGTANDRKTTVRLLRGAKHDQSIVSDQINDYLTLMIDLIFLRSDGGGQRLNVPQMMLLDNNPFKPVLQAMHTHLGQFTGQLRAGPNGRGVRQRMNPDHGPEEYWTVRGVEYYSPLLSSAWGATFKSWNDLMTSLSKGRIISTKKAAAARQAAEVFAIFVSDHLPLLATIRY